MYHSNLLLRHHYRVLAPDSCGHGESGGGMLTHGPQDTNSPQIHSLRIQAANPAHIALWAPPNTPHVMALSRHPAEFERRVVSWFQPANR